MSLYTFDFWVHLRRLALGLSGACLDEAISCLWLRLELEARGRLVHDQDQLLHAAMPCSGQWAAGHRTAIRSAQWILEPENIMAII